MFIESSLHFFVFVIVIFDFYTIESVTVIFIATVKYDIGIHSVIIGFILFVLVSCAGVVFVYDFTVTIFFTVKLTIAIIFVYILVVK